MRISYHRLLKLMIDKNMKKKDLGPYWVECLLHCKIVAR